ncbi:hypothetical protein ACHAP8_008201 [Fusarium lateritium]
MFSDASAVYHEPRDPNKASMDNVMFKDEPSLRTQMIDSGLQNHILIPRAGTRADQECREPLYQTVEETGCEKKMHTSGLNRTVKGPPPHQDLPRRAEVLVCNLNHQHLLMNDRQQPVAACCVVLDPVDLAAPTAPSSGQQKGAYEDVVHSYLTHGDSTASVSSPHRAKGLPPRCDDP